MQFMSITNQRTHNEHSTNLLTTGENTMAFLLKDGSSVVFGRVGNNSSMTLTHSFIDEETGEGKSVDVQLTSSQIEGLFIMAGSDFFDAVFSQQDKNMIETPITCRVYAKKFKTFEFVTRIEQDLSKQVSPLKRTKNAPSTSQ